MGTYSDISDSFEFANIENFYISKVKINLKRELELVQTTRAQYLTLIHSDIQS